MNEADRRFMERLEGKVDAMNTEVMNIKLELHGTTSKVKEMHRDLYQNGVKKTVRDLIDRMSGVEDRHEAEDEASSGRKKTFQWILEQLNHAVPWLITLGLLLYAVLGKGG